MLTTAQLQALKADILANAAQGQPLAAFYAANDLNSIADWYNGASAVHAWRTEAPVTGILDAVDWTKYTPNDAAAETLIGVQRILITQTKQMNLQNMLFGRTTLDCSKAGIRAGLRDSVISVPTSASGANTNPGGANGGTVLSACRRLANRIEALLAGGEETTGATAARVLAYEGTIGRDEVQQALES